VHAGGCRTSWRPYVLFLAKIAVAAALLSWLFASGKLDFSPLRSIRHRGFLVLSVGALGLSMLLPVWRWLMLVKLQELELAWGPAIGMTWMGYFAGLFLPGATGGDLAKAYLACRSKPDAKTRAVSTVLMDRVVGLQSLLLLGGAGGVALPASGCGGRLAAVAWLSLALLGCSMAALFGVLWPPTSGRMLRLVPQRFRATLDASLGLYRRSWRKLPYVLLYSCLCNALAVAAYVLAALALGEPFGSGEVLAVPLVVVANSLPISPGGLGVGETVGASLFAEFGSVNGGLIVLLVRLGVWMLSLPGALAMFRAYGHERLVVMEQAETQVVES
jgi:uncharacterized membrane protein YbhN (UPF0104 family)